MTPTLSRNAQAWLSTAAVGRLDCRDCSATFVVHAVIERAKANIFLGRLGCEHVGIELCAKQFTMSEPSDIERLFRRGQLVQPELTRLGYRVPEFLGFSAEDQIILMTFARGTPLENIVVRSFFGGTAQFERCCNIIRELGQLQARLSSLRVPADAAFANPCPNAEYVDRLRPYLEEPFVASCLAGSAVDPARLFDQLPSAFWDRNEQRLLHGDFQVKNVLIGEEMVTRSSMRLSFLCSCCACSGVGPFRAWPLT